MKTGLFRIFVAGLLAASLTGVGANRSAAKVRVTEKTSYYKVSGLTGLELGRSMLRGGGQAINLRHAIAATTTTFDFEDAKLALERGRCVVKDITVHLVIEYQLPRWNGRGRATADVRRKWDAFYAELVRHEKTHGRIAKDFSGKVEQAMKKLSGTAMLGCNDFGAFSGFRFSALSNQLKRLQLAFDRRESRPTSRISRLQSALIEAR